MLEDLEAVKTERLTGLARALGNGGEGAAAAERFAEIMFAHVAAEDVARYTVAELDALAIEAFGHFSRRKLGNHSIRVFDPNLPAVEGEEKAITVVEILNDDMPFLFGSVMNELQAQGVTVELVVHPIFTVERTGAGDIVSFTGDTARVAGRSRESLIHVHVTRLAEDERAACLAGLEATVTDVRRAVLDWEPMRRRIRGVIRRYEETPPPVPTDKLQEAISLLDLAAESDFIIVGVREYALSGSVDEGELTPVEDGGLGILRDPNLFILRRGEELVTMTPEIREFLKQPEPLIITKANARSRVHRRTHLDYIGAKLFDGDGNLSGELRIVGLFTSEAYTKSVLEIPYVRGKVRSVMDRLGFDMSTHSGKALLNILETYPRDELFQIDEDLLAAFARAILQLSERPRVRVLPRIDKFDRFVSVMVFVPRERFSTDTRMRIEAFLSKVYEGTISARYAYIPEGPLVRLHVIVRRIAGGTPVVPQDRLEDGVADIVRTWTDDLLNAARRGRRLPLTRHKAETWGEAFTASYQATYAAEGAIEDIRTLSLLSADEPVAIRFLRRQADDHATGSLKIFHRDRPVPLSARVPVLEAMGFTVVNERTFRVVPPESEATVYIHDMTLRRAGGAALDIDRRGDALTSMFMAVWKGLAESDGLNALLLNAGIGWREVAMLRAVSRYLRQVGTPYSQGFIAEALNAHPELAGALVSLFRVRFDPDLSDRERDGEIRSVSAGINELLEDVESLNDDTIIRRFRNVIDATVRTNFFQVGGDGRPVETFVFKILSEMVTGMPKPRPFREIWVYSPRVEGIHMRFGFVARGGLRWSDRPQDFRTEILGLVKAQQVKNAVIVPVGAKGGFFPKRLPDRSQREAFFEEGREAYKIFVSSLLGVTDDIEPDGTVRPPVRVKRHDGDDPYLVVAADKGTATFSDTANAISEKNGFWLGDAFASGGSQGYDHKAMGITARGAWEAVKRHFREMDRDIQSEPFTAIGVGDMSGDVFGNGMLLSPCTRLVAAFDHRDVFIDPDPDPAVSFEERRRLFDKPRSSWADYDKAKISKGGGVFSRSLKSVPLSPEARAALGIEAGQLTPAELIRAILKAPADLLWFGGIGTYVRARAETNADVGDKANDPVRVAADELCVKVIGEGANLGMTQAARIEFARRGGRVNSDAIDNSAGVNTSDVEVNIKIALGAAERAGRLDRAGRNALLVDMTEKVAALVLRNNYLQTLAISLSEREGAAAAGFQMRLMHVLEARAGLDRALEFLPSDQDLSSRAAAGEGLSRPEIGVLLAYAKLKLYDDLVASGVPDDPYLGREIRRYFPPQMDERFPEEIAGHRLRREIIATMVSNAMINRGGPTFMVKVGDQTGATVEVIALAFAAARGVFDLSEINERIDALDNQVPGAVQLALYRAVQVTLIEGTVWFIRNFALDGGVEHAVRHFGERIDRLDALVDGLLPQTRRTAIEETAGAWIEAGVPEALAREVASLGHAGDFLDITLVADECVKPLEAVAATYFAVEAAFALGRLDRLAAGLTPGDYYEGLALDRARRVLSEAHRRITLQAVRDSEAEEAEARVADWIALRESAVARTRESIEDIAGVAEVTVARLTVAASLLADLTADRR